MEKKGISLNFVICLKTEIEMLQIYIHGIKDGEYEVNLDEKLDVVPNLKVEEFFGILKFNGKMQKSGNRFNVKGKASVQANLICDRSLQEFQEEVFADVSLSFLADTKLFVSDNRSTKNDDEIIIHEDDKNLDITYEVLELLELQLPMKRISPEFRDKEIDEIFPELKSKFKNDVNDEIDDRWSKLKNLKLN